MKNFNIDFFDKNHNWDDVDLFLGETDYNYHTYYNIICKKCELGIYCWNDVVNNEFNFSVYKSKNYICKYVIYLVKNGIIDYNKVPSCNEMIIKNLLE